jgi:hypothetical protein
MMDIMEDLFFAVPSLHVRTWEHLGQKIRLFDCPLCLIATAAFGGVIGLLGVNTGPMRE